MSWLEPELHKPSRSRAQDPIRPIRFPIGQFCPFERFFFSKLPQTNLFRSVGRLVRVPKREPVGFAPAAGQRACSSPIAILASHYHFLLLVAVLPRIKLFRVWCSGLIAELILYVYFVYPIFFCIFGTIWFLYFLTSCVELNSFCLIC